MNPCDHIRAQIAFYLDGELHDQELRDFESHLRECAMCARRCDAERGFLESVRAARPLYSAPQRLVENVTRLLVEAAAPAAASRTLRDRIHRTLRSIPPSPSRLGGGRRAAALAACLLIFAIAAVWYFTARRDQAFLYRPSDIALMAVESHLRHLRGQLPLEIVTDSPAQVSAWFAGKVSFGLKLPNYQEASGQDKLYNIEGARLVAFKNDYAAFVSYRMRQRPITLVVTSNAVAVPSGGEKIVSKGLTFHYDAINGQKVITWSDRGLTYALVSDLEERGQQSCIVCHTGTKDRDFIEELRPSR